MSHHLKSNFNTDPFKGAPSFPFMHRLFRLVWRFVWFILSSWTPPSMHKWRVLLLRLAGADVHYSAHVYGSAKIWFPPNLHMDAQSCLGPNVNCYNMSPISLGSGAIVSQGAFLCTGTHDIDSINFQIQSFPINIGSNAWVAADSFIGPGVDVGEGAVVGARSVLFKDADSWCVYAGNPARYIKNRSNAILSREIV